MGIGNVGESTIYCIVIEQMNSFITFSTTAFTLPIKLLHLHLHSYINTSHQTSLFTHSNKLIGIPLSRMLMGNLKFCCYSMAVVMAMGMVLFGAAVGQFAQGGDGGRRAEMVPAMFVFGDSLIDNGNNNNLPSFAKANYFPYGIDFNGGPTGRFSNGYTMVDEIGMCM